ncbi:MAG: metallophosphoesterase [Proteobacteria bacterium]|nr:metallophosphoesterase [Pseudomonadota bacterium]
MRSLFVLLFLTVACDDGGPVSLNDDSETDTDTDADADSDTDTDADTDTDSDPPPIVRFVALGDGGEGNDEQHLVGDLLAEVCASRGCDFALYLGDNIYDSGVSSDEDAQFSTKFEIPYQPVDMPFYVVLGNHDLGGDGLGVDLDPNKASYEVAYSQFSDKWDMEAPYYTIPDVKVPREPAQFFALNTTEIFFGWNDGDQKDWFRQERDASDSTWKIAFGHHPYISNGRHGNAGNYEGIADWVPLSEIPRGAYVKDFMDDEICGKVDVYLSGHDHNLQWLEPTCGTQFIVAGSAAKTTEWGDESRNPVSFQTNGDELACGGGEGFVWIEIEGTTLTGYTYHWRDDCSGNPILEENGPFTLQK